MHKYQITLVWSDEDDLFVANIPELPGCMAHGDTHEEALAEAQADPKPRRRACGAINLMGRPIMAPPAHIGEVMASQPMLRYRINIFWSDEDGMYVTAVPELPGCSALGDTYEEALQEAQVAMSLWIDTANELGHSTPTPACELMSLTP